MDNDLLKSVIALETELHAQLNRERARAAAWYEREAAQAERELVDYERRLAARERAWVAAAEARLRQRWQRWQKTESDRQRDFAAFAAERLPQLLADGLKDLLPDMDDDHQDVEG